MSSWAISCGVLVVFLYGVELPRAITSIPGTAVSLPRICVRDSVGEVVVLGSSEVLERQDGDALDAAKPPRRLVGRFQRNSAAAASTTSAAPAIASFFHGAFGPAG